MLGTSMSLTTARILSYSQRDDFDFEYIKLEAIKADFLQTIKRVGSFDMYKSYQSIVEQISTHKELLSEIDKLGKTFAEKGIDTKKIDLYADYAKRSLSATKESCVKTYQHLLKDFDMLTPNNECKMLMTIQKFDENGNIFPLFRTNENGQIETFVDEHGVERNLINMDILDWSNAEKFYKFANSNNFKIHGHAILWHEAVPYQIQELANSDLPPETKKKMTQDFLYCYMKSYAHNAKVNGIKLESIDILNEIANDDENSEDFLRQSVWRDLMGDDFYIDVLKMAKQAFPDTKLMYNDFSEFYPAKRSNRDGFNKDPRHTPAMLDEFFTYLTNISNEIGIDRFREFLEDTLSQMEIDFDDLSKQDHTKNTCFKNLFLKYLVKSHPKDVQLINSKTPIEELSPETDISTIDLKIGGMSIGDIHFKEVAGNPPMITFTDLRTLPGLERMGLGSYVFREFCKQVNEHKHGYSVLAWNVVKDKDGSKVYPKWGAYPVKAYVENDFWEIDTTPLTDKEMDEWYGAHGRAYYFSPEKIEEISKQPNNRYGKQEKVEELAL